MNTTLTPEQRFGIFKKTGYYVSYDTGPTKPKPKPTGYELVDVSAGKRTLIQRVARENYGLLVYLKQQRQNQHNKLEIKAIY